MALQTILDNVRSFLQLLLAAKSDPIDWDERSYENAFKWAEYCEKIYLQSDGKPYRTRLDNEVKKIAASSYGSDIGNLKVELDLFKNCVQLLTMILVFNDRIKKEQEMIAVMRKYFDQETLNRLQIIFSQWKHLKKNANNLEVATESLINVILCYTSLEFCHYLTVKILLKEQLFKLILTKDGFMVFVECFATLSKVGKCSSAVKFKRALDLFHNFLPELYSVSHNFKKEFMNLCIKDEVLLEDFLQHLINAGQSFKIHYNTLGEGCRFLFEWRNDDEKSLTYTSMLEWFDFLLNESNNINIITSTSLKLSHAANNSDLNIFKTLCQELRKFSLLDDWIFD